MKKIFSQLKQIKTKKGFSLIELVVVLAIFLIITTVALVKQSKFSSDILVTDTAYDVSLAIREAQVYGLGSKQDIDSSDQSFRSPYGVHFDAGIPGSYVKFADRDKSKTYDSSEQNGELGVLPTGYTINQICAYGPSTTNCSGGGSFTMDISFARPSPDAIITINGSSYQYFSATISILSSTGEKSKMIKVEKTGLISVCQTTPCT